jgi:2-polyprenyl-3-methyl-5-hydroxy-6-metoxy-1,4-benzoquinol methylase
MNSLAVRVKSPCMTPVDYYEVHADEYCRSTVGLDMTSVSRRFLSELAPGSHILDAGCGSGRDSKVFLQSGHTVTAFDASPEMARFATAYTGQKCRVLRFQEVDFQEKFDAIWACASLLHVPRCEMESVLRRLIAALRSGGIMYVSFIEGEGERVSADGRLYNSYTAKSLRELLEGMSMVGEIAFWRSDEIPSSDQRAPWLNCLFKKSMG